MASGNLYTISVLTLFLIISSVVNGFVTNPQAMRSTLAANGKISFARLAAELNDFEEKINLNDESSTRNPKLIIDQARKATTALASVWLVSSQVALADSPDWGVFEGRIGSLLHPVAMGGMFVLSMYTAYLGFQWRRQRTLGDEISSLKKSIPDLGGAGSVSAALAAAKEANDLYKINALTAALEIESKVNSLVAERKTLAEAGLRDKHFQQGSLLAFIGTCFAIEGPLNTYARAGKLFPGPHLYAGAGLVCLWALAVACVPSMQKGNDLARSVHIGANVAGIGLFAWQVTSGLPILFKVWELTKWP